MSETKHTPGEIYFYELRDSSNDGLGYIRTDADTLEICHHGDSRRSADENRANAARFIRAWNCHDELVAACQAVVDACTSAPPMDLIKRFGECADKCAAVLAKATTPTP